MNQRKSFDGGWIRVVAVSDSFCENLCLFVSFINVPNVASFSRVMCACLQHETNNNSVWFVPSMLPRMYGDFWRLHEAPHCSLCHQSRLRLGLTPDMTTSWFLERERLGNSTIVVFMWFVILRQRCHVDSQICNLFILVSSHGKTRMMIPECIWGWIPNSCMFEGNARVAHSKFYTLLRMIRDGKCVLKLFDQIVSHRWM